MNSHLEHAWNDVASALRGYIRARVPDHFAAEDILQDVFLKAHTRGDQLGHEHNLRGWLFRIARNTIIDYQRKLRGLQELDQELPNESADLDLEPAEAERLNASFHRMIHSLSEPYREALILTDLEGVSQAELAARLGLSLSGAKSRVQRARQMLRKDLEACCRFEFDRRGNIIDYTPRGQCCGGSAQENPPQKMP